jgi:hypothetical protein
VHRFEFPEGDRLVKVGELITLGSLTLDGLVAFVACSWGLQLSCGGSLKLGGLCGVFLGSPIKLWR